VQVDPGEPVAADLAADQPDQPSQLGRVRIAGRIGETDFIAAQCNQLMCQPNHAVCGDVSFERAAKCRGQAALERGAPIGRQRVEQRDDLAHFLEHLCVRLAQIGLAVRLTDRERQRNLMGSRLDRVLSTFEVGHQRGHGQVRNSARKGDDFAGVRELRQQFRWDKRADLDLTHPGSRLGHNPGFLSLGRHDGLNTLQAVPRTDFADQYLDFAHRVFHRLD
jgi:hypothetical protein